MDALYADADFAGCVESLRSTSGGHLHLQGPNTLSRDYMYLAYEVTDRMAADIYTKPRRSMMDANGNMHVCKRMEMGSDLGTCMKWIEDIGVPAIYAYSACYSAKCRGMMKGEGQSMRVALEFISKVFGQLSADECMRGWREFCSKGKKIVAALNQLCGEASLLAKNPELLNVTKYCIEGADMLRSIADIWDLASGVAEDNEERSFTAAFHQDTPVGEVYKEFISDEPTRTSSSRRWRSSEEFLTTAEFERHDRRISKFRDRSWEGIHVERDQGSQA